jgi:hypothetical protein
MHDRLRGLKRSTTGIVVDGMSQAEKLATLPPAGTHLLRSCPTCGRRLSIRAEHLGQPVACAHCRSTLDGTWWEDAGEPTDEEDSIRIQASQRPVLRTRPREATVSEGLDEVPASGRSPTRIK